MVQLDGTNLRLLELLQDDARTSIIDLARAVDRAESTVRERIAALERDGVLRGYRAVVEPEKLGYRVRAIVRCGGDRARIGELAKKLTAIPQVIRVDVTTGARPLCFEVMAESLARLEQVLQERIAPLGLEAPEVDVVLRCTLPLRPPAIHGAPVAIQSPAEPAEGEPAVLQRTARAPEAAKAALVLPSASR